MGGLEYDFILSPNADYIKIIWEIKGDSLNVVFLDDKILVV
jgi:hypothetical protein